MKIAIPLSENVLSAHFGLCDQSLFNQKGIKVVSGAEILDPEELITRYLDGILITGSNICDRH